MGQGLAPDDDRPRTGSFARCTSAQETRPRALPMAGRKHVADEAAAPPQKPGGVQREGGQVDGVERGERRDDPSKGPTSAPPTSSTLPGCTSIFPWRRGDSRASFARSRASISAEASTRSRVRDSWRGGWRRCRFHNRCRGSCRPARTRDRSGATGPGGSFRRLHSADRSRRPRRRTRARCVLRSTFGCRQSSAERGHWRRTGRGAPPNRTSADARARVPGSDDRAASRLPSGARRITRPRGRAS